MFKKKRIKKEQQNSEGTHKVDLLLEMRQFTNSLILK